LSKLEKGASYPGLEIIAELANRAGGRAGGAAEEIKAYPGAHIGNS
jgi:hypothetical protein